MMKVSLCFVLGLLSLTSAHANTLKGEVSLSGKGENRAKLSDIVIYYQPKIAQQNPILKQPLEIGMKRKAYHPRVSVVPKGSEIRVTNYDRILHNAFSPSGINSFDMGLYGQNQEKLHKLDKEGVVRIFCNVHYHMVAYVLVLETPYVTRPNNQGEFTLNNLPQGEGELIVWHERGNRVVQSINLPYNDELDIEIPITKRRIPEHKMKTGKSYKKVRRRRR